MIGRRCDLGCETWPDLATFATCLICGERAKRWSNVTPMPQVEAEQIMAHQSFEKFYARHCERLGQSVDGPLAEAI